MMQVSFRNLPGMSKLFLDYLYDWNRVQEFYSSPYDLNSLISFSRKRMSEPLAHREQLCRTLAEQQRSWGGRTESVEKLARGAVAVVAGQQPGLFTGPTYTIMKAVTAIRLARAIDDAGVPAVPLFWIAAEDHDHEEISSTFVLDRESALHRFRVDLSNEIASPVGFLQFKGDVNSVVTDCLSSLPQSEFHADLRSALESSYQSGRSPVDAFARLMTKLFGDFGLILANPIDPELKSIARPILNEVAKRNSEVRTSVLRRSRMIADCGYHEQVKVDENFTGLFALRDKSREALRPDDLSMDLTFSPNVLVRPLVQDTIFPTAALIAGPAEIAYLAQASVVYETMGRMATPVFPRISATILETRVGRSLRKYDMKFEDVFHGKDFLKRRAVEQVQGIDIFAKVKQRVVENLELLRDPLRVVDPTLTGALDTARQKMMHQVDALETKFVNAEARRNDVMEKQLDLIVNSVFPEKKLQERVLNVTTFLARYGTGFLRHLEEAVSLDSTQHQIIEI